MKILISTSSFGKFDNTPLKLLEENGCEVLLNPHGRKLSEEEIKELIVDVDGLIAGTEPLTEEVLGSAKKLRLISRCGTGLDSVDLNAAGKLGIKVFNTPDAPTLAVAELTVALILNLLRKVNKMDADIRNDKWKKQMGNLLHGKRIGIIGFGRIGQKVGTLLSVFGAELAYCDVEPKMCSYQCGEKKFEEILNWADIITLHLSSSADCSPVIGYKEIKSMKKGAWLINVSRGGIIDEEALYNALKEGHLSGAALDVFEKEPYAGSLKEMDNIIMTPHIGSYAKEARAEMEMQSVVNLLKGLEVVN